MSSLAKIHIGKKQLGLQDEDYRDLLERSTGKRSSADMTETQRQAVLGEMERLGFKPAPSSDKRSPHAHVRKVFAVWGDMARKGQLKNPDKGALHAFCQRQTGVSNAEWLSAAQASKVVEGLKAIQRRAARGEGAVEA
jgi:phage gp16-like protein